MRSLAGAALLLGAASLGCPAYGKTTDDLLSDVETMLGEAPAKPKADAKAAEPATSAPAAASSDDKAGEGSASAVMALLNTKQGAAHPAAAGGPAPLGGFSQFQNLAQQQQPGMGGVPQNPFAGQMLPQQQQQFSQRMSGPGPQFGGAGMLPVARPNMRFASASAYHNMMGAAPAAQQMVPVQMMVPQQQPRMAPAQQQQQQQQPAVGLGGRKPWAPPNNAAHPVGGVPPPTSLLESFAASSTASTQQQQQQQQERRKRLPHHSAYQGVRAGSNRNTWSVSNFHIHPKVEPEAVRQASGLPAHLLDAGETYAASPLPAAAPPPEKLALVEEKVTKDGDVASFVETSKAGDGRSEVAVRQRDGGRVNKREQAHLLAQQRAEQKAQQEALIMANIYDYGSHKVGEPGSSGADTGTTPNVNPQPVQMKPTSRNANPSWKYDKSSEVAAADTWLQNQRGRDSLLEKSSLDGVDDPVGAGVPSVSVQLDNTVGTDMDAAATSQAEPRFQAVSSGLRRAAPTISAFYAAHGASPEQLVPKQSSSRSSSSLLRGGDTNRETLISAHEKAVDELHNALAKLREDVSDDPAFSEPRFQAKPSHKDVLSAQENRAAVSDASAATLPSPRQASENSAAPATPHESDGAGSSTSIVKPDFDNKKPLAQEGYRRGGKLQRDSGRVSHGGSARPSAADKAARAIEAPSFSNKKPLSARDESAASALRFQSASARAHAKAQAMLAKAMKNKHAFPDSNKIHWHGWVKQRKTRAHDRILEAMAQQLRL